MSVYLDASVLLPTVIPEPGSGAVDRFLAQATSELLVSDFAVAEVASGISRLVRMRLLDSRRANLMLAAFDAWRAAGAQPADMESADVRWAAIVVRRFDLMLRAPDALHLAICQRLEARLVTMDVRLAAAAEKLRLDATLVA